VSFSNPAAFGAGGAGAAAVAAAGPTEAAGAAVAAGAEVAAGVAGSPPREPQEIVPEIRRNGRSREGLFI
jgi:hypothetical protein